MTVSGATHWSGCVIWRKTRGERHESCLRFGFGFVLREFGEHRATREDAAGRAISDAAGWGDRVGAQRRTGFHRQGRGDSGLHQDRLSDGGEGNEWLCLSSRAVMVGRVRRSE